MPAARNTEDIVALSLVVLANWLIAHLATSWVLPPEVSSAVQTLIVVGFGKYLDHSARVVVPQPHPEEPHP